MYRNEKEQTAFDVALTVGGSMRALDGLIAGNPAEEFVPHLDVRQVINGGIEVPAEHCEETWTPQWSDRRELDTRLVQRSLGDMIGGIRPPIRNNNGALEIAIQQLRDESLASLIYNFEGNTIIERYPFGTVVTLKTPQQVGFVVPDGYRFDNWMLDGQPVTEVVMNENVSITGTISQIMLTITYYFSVATPNEVVETYPWGTNVVLKSPAELGMTYDSTIALGGWVDGGEEVVSLVLTSNVIVEERWFEGGENLLRESRRFLNEDDLPIAPPTLTNQINRLIFDSSTKRYGLARVFAKKEGAIVVGRQYVLSYRADSRAPETNPGSGAINVDCGVSSVSGARRGRAYINKVYVDGVLHETFTDGRPLVGHVRGTMAHLQAGAHLIEILFTVDIADETIPLFSDTGGTVASGGGIVSYMVLCSYYQLEDVTDRVEWAKRATPWTPAPTDAPDMMVPDSYYKVNNEQEVLSGRLIPFSASDTPLENFSDDQSGVHPVIICGDIRMSDTIQELCLWNSYNGFSMSPTLRYFSYYLNIRYIFLPNVVGSRSIIQIMRKTPENTSDAIIKNKATGARSTTYGYYYSAAEDIEIPAIDYNDGWGGNDHLLDGAINLRRLRIGNNNSLTWGGSTNIMLGIPDEQPITLIGTRTAVESWKTFKPRSGWSEEYVGKILIQGQVLNPDGNPYQGNNATAYIYKHSPNGPTLIDTVPVDTNGMYQYELGWQTQAEYQALSPIVVEVWSEEWSYGRGRSNLSTLPAWKEWASDSDIIVVQMPNINLEAL